MRRLSLPGMLLWLEAAGLSALAVTQGRLWLVPPAAVLALLAALLTRGLRPALGAALILPALWIWQWRHAPAPDVQPPVFLAVLFLLCGALCAFAGILAGLNRAAAPGSYPGAERLCRLAAFAHFPAAGLLLAGRHLELPAYQWLAWSAAVFSITAAVDTLARLIVRLYTPRRHWAALPAPGDFFFLHFRRRKSSKETPAAAVSPDQDSFTLKLPEMWMWPVIRRALPALAVTAALLTWLATGLHEVRAGALGVRHRCGAWGLQNLDPGLHVSLPWPFGGVQQIDTAFVRETILGFRADPGQPILWERNHYEDEQKSLVGSGDDFLSISVPVLHRIEDPAAWLRSSNDPENLLRTVSSRILLQLTLHRPAAELMTTAREPLRERFRHDLQAELDEQRSGLRVTEVLLRDIHPPVAVAPAFQEVVGALEEKEAFLHGGTEYRNDVLTRARGDAAQVVITAEATAADRLDRTRGETARFASRQTAWRESPSLFAFREGFQAFDAALGGAKKVIFDEKLRGAIPAHLDLRKVLNPDLVNTAPSALQTLVPRPDKSRDPFDLDIEGLLRQDRGEIPAVNVRQDDGDNLLAPDPTPTSP